MEYNKPALSITDQLVTLQRRGLTIRNQDLAEEFLNNVSYFRFAAYLRVFEQSDSTFRTGSTFEQAATIYKFDVELRKLLFGAIQQIEIALRSRIIHQFSLAHGPFWFLETSLAIDKLNFVENLTALKRELERTKEEFIRTHTMKYGTTNFPPAWKMLELVSFVCLTKLFMNFTDVPTKKRISRSFGVAKYECLESWMKAINALRNHCALKAVCDKTGTNGLQAFELWKKLSEEDRRAAFAHAQRMQGSPASRSYLFVYLRDRQWEYVECYEQTDTEI